MVSEVQHSLEEKRCPTVHVMVKAYLLCFCMGVTKCPWRISARRFQSLELWIGSRLCGCILPCPVPLVGLGGHCLCPFLLQLAGLGYVLSDTPTAFTAEGRYFRTKSIIMDHHYGFEKPFQVSQHVAHDSAFLQKKWS